MIIPGILEKDFEAIEKEVSAVDQVATLIQIDVSDGTLVKTKTFKDVGRLSEINTKANFEIHLMVKDPLKYIQERITNVKKISAHIEGKNTHNFLVQAKDLGYEVGVSINPETPVEKLAPYITKVDFVQFMTVSPGGQGRAFDPGVLDKIRVFSQTSPEIPIQVDGGINEGTMGEVIEAGANNVVIGSQIFQDPKQSFESFSKFLDAVVSKKHVHAGEKIRKIGFFGGAGWEKESPTYKQAYETAVLLAKEGYEIVNGGGPGVMRAATEGSQKGGGRTLAVTYHPAYKHKNYEGTDPLNKFDEEIITVDYFDRTKVMLQNTDVHVIFKGGTGTISEFGMSWASSRIHEGHHKPIILFGKFWEHIIQEFEAHMLMRQGELDLIKIVETPKECADYIKNL